MAFGWDDAIMIAASLYSGSQGGKAADATTKASKQAIALQQEQWLAALRMLEPNRALGYGATSDLASLYGYRLPEYTPLSQLGGAATGGAGSGSSNWTVGAPITVGGHAQSGHSWTDPKTYLGGGKAKRVGGLIDPVAGTVDAYMGGGRGDEAATAYLRGESDSLKGKKLKKLRNAIDDLKAQGWEWNPGMPEPTAGVLPAPSDGAAAADPMARFFASPDYNFRRTEGMRGLENSAAARGGAFSGNAIRGATEFNSNLAAGEFGNYVSRLMAMAGIGTGATTQAIGAGQSMANNVGSLYGNIGNARASSYEANNNAVQGGIQNWMFNNYLRGGGGGSGYTVPSDISGFNSGMNTNYNTTLFGKP